jgi:hypothetical protein
VIFMIRYVELSPHSIMGEPRAYPLTFGLTQGLFGTFDSYNDKLINYNVPAEVEKIVSQ